MGEDVYFRLEKWSLAETSSNFPKSCFWNAGEDWPLQENQELGFQAFCSIPPPRSCLYRSLLSNFQTFKSFLIVFKSLSLLIREHPMSLVLWNWQRFSSVYQDKCPHAFDKTMLWGCLIVSVCQLGRVVGYLLHILYSFWWLRLLLLSLFDCFVSCSYIAKDGCGFASLVFISETERNARPSWLLDSSCHLSFLHSLLWY